MRCNSLWSDEVEDYSRCCVNYLGDVWAFYREDKAVITTLFLYPSYRLKRYNGCLANSAVFYRKGRTDEIYKTCSESRSRIASNSTYWSIYVAQSIVRGVMLLLHCFFYFFSELTFPVLLFILMAGSGTVASLGGGQPVRRAPTGDPTLLLPWLAAGIW